MLLMKFDTIYFSFTQQHLGLQQYITMRILDLKDKIYFLYTLLTPSPYHTPPPLPKHFTQSPAKNKIFPLTYLF